MAQVCSVRSQKQKRQYLRSNESVYERMLWSKLQGGQVLGFKFFRRHDIGVFILDFYCPECKLAIELDRQPQFNPAVQEYDRLREEFLELYGIEFLRFTNSEVRNNLDGVLHAVATVARERALAKLIQTTKRLAAESSPPTYAL